VTSDSSDLSSGSSPPTQRLPPRQLSATEARLAAQRAEAADEWAMLDSGGDSPTPAVKTLSKMSDHVADDPSFDSDEEDGGGSSSTSDYATSGTGAAGSERGSTGKDEPPSSGGGSSGGPYSQMTKSVGASPHGETIGGNFNPQVVTSDSSEQLSSRDSPAKRPKGSPNARDSPGGGGYTSHLPSLVWLLGQSIRHANGNDKTLGVD
jgi:hypothetical protein